MYGNKQIHTFIGNEKITFFNEAGYWNKKRCEDREKGLS
jgi:hypothetical protein